MDDELAFVLLVIVGIGFLAGCLGALLHMHRDTPNGQDPKQPVPTQPPAMLRYRRDNAEHHP